MASVVLTGDTSGQVTLSAPAIAGSNTITLPAATGTTELIGTGTVWTYTSGAPSSVDFTGIPSWVKRITVMLAGVSLSGSDQLVLRLGYGGTPTYISSGYATGNSTFNASSIGATANPTGGFYITSSGATQLNSGVFTLALVAGNIWAISGSSFASNATRGVISAGSVDVTATLTSIRFVGETSNTFDAGSINILYEG